MELDAICPHCFRKARYLTKISVQMRPEKTAYQGLYGRFGAFLPARVWMGLLPIRVNRVLTMWTFTRPRQSPGESQ